MSKTKAQIKTAVLRDYGFDVGQNSDLDDKADEAILDALRGVSKMPWQWSRVRDATATLTSGTATLTLSNTVGVLDEKNVRIQDGSGSARLIEWMDPMIFDQVYGNDFTRSGRPRAFTSEEYTETKVLRFFPTPNSAYTIRFAYHRNIEFDSDGTALTDSDVLVAPNEVDELIILWSRLHMSMLVYGESDQRTRELFQRTEIKKGELKQLLVSADPEIRLIPPPESVGWFDQGV